MSIANFANPNNPFQDIGIRKRNHLMFIDWNCLKKNIKNRNFYLSLLNKDIFHYSASSLELHALRKFCIHQKAISERTGEIIHVTARRFHHTRGTNLGRKGVGATIIAELLDHTDTQNVKVYTKIQLIQCNTLIVLWVLKWEN